MKASEALEISHWVNPPLKKELKAELEWFYEKIKEMALIGSVCCAVKFKTQDYNTRCEVLRHLRREGYWVVKRGEMLAWVNW